MKGRQVRELERKQVNQFFRAWVSQTSGKPGIMYSGPIRWTNGRIWKNCEQEKTKTGWAAEWGAADQNNKQKYKWIFTNSEHFMADFRELYKTTTISFWSWSMISMLLSRLYINGTNRTFLLLAYNPKWTKHKNFCDHIRNEVSAFVIVYSPGMIILNANKFLFQHFGLSVWASLVLTKGERDVRGGREAKIRITTV